MTNWQDQPVPAELRFPYQCPASQSADCRPGHGRQSGFQSFLCPLPGRRRPTRALAARREIRARTSAAPPRIRLRLQPLDNGQHISAPVHLRQPQRCSHRPDPISTIRHQPNHRAGNAAQSAGRRGHGHQLPSRHARIDLRVRRRNSATSTKDKTRIRRPMTMATPPPHEPVPQQLSPIHTSTAEATTCLRSPTWTLFTAYLAANPAQLPLDEATTHQNSDASNYNLQERVAPAT